MKLLCLDSIWLVVLSLYLDWLRKNSSWKHSGGGRGDVAVTSKSLVFYVLQRVKYGIEAHSLIQLFPVASLFEHDGSDILVQGIPVSSRKDSWMRFKVLGSWKYVVYCLELEIGPQCIDSIWFFPGCCFLLLLILHLNWYRSWNKSYDPLLVWPILSFRFHLFFYFPFFFYSSAPLRWGILNSYRRKRFIYLVSIFLCLRLAVYKRKNPLSLCNVWIRNKKPYVMGKSVLLQRQCVATVSADGTRLYCP